ncbi:MAG: alpha/beta fold hydrolase [Candidatus Kerfeldbacteria bacterium]|nr:alpha/beta fold hydrolase [Candidatus Kerfeldbacteria bacterium]
MKVEIRHHHRTIRGDLQYPKRRAGKLPAIVIVHGRTVDRDYPPLLPRLRRELRGVGFVTLAIDLSGHGQSGGRFENLTYTRAAEDVEAAVRFLTRQPRVNPFSVGGIGHSLGGTAVFLAKHRGAPLKTLVLLAPVGDTAYHRRHRFSTSVVRTWRRKGIMELWYSQRVKRTFALRFSYYADLKRYDTVRMARDIHQPVFIIHGSRDNNVSSIESRHLYHALNEPKRLLVIPGARHNFNERDHQRTVVSAVKQWLREYLAKKVSRSVAVFVMNKELLLIMKRSQLVGYYRGRWGVIGGHLHKGATPLEQAYAELREETGLRRSDLKLIRVGKTVRIVDSEKGKVWLSTSFLFESKMQRVKLDWEHTAFKWVPVKSFPFKRSYPGIEKQFKALGLL